MTLNRDPLTQSSLRVHLSRHWGLKTTRCVRTLDGEKKYSLTARLYLKSSVFALFFFSSGLGPSPLHQTLPPGYPPSLPGSMPPPYQFARDPQSGQLIVIPAEHLPHYGTKAAACLWESQNIWNRMKAFIAHTVTDSKIWQESAGMSVKHEGFSSWDNRKKMDWFPTTDWYISHMLSPSCL